jgi:hypothetical protein
MDEVNVNPRAMGLNAEGENIQEVTKVKLMTVTEIDMRGVQEWGNARTQILVFDCLLCLDTVLEPGLPKADFQKLFVSCKSYGYVMTKRFFWAHNCKGQVVSGEGNLIDLMGED